MNEAAESPWDHVGQAPPVTWVDIARRLAVLEPADWAWRHRPPGLLGAQIDWGSATFLVRPGQSEGEVLIWLETLFPNRISAGRKFSLEGPAHSSELPIEFEVVDEESLRRSSNTTSVDGYIRFDSYLMPAPIREIPVIAFHSVKGGTGRTTTAVAMATLLADRMKKPILIVDADLEAPGLSYLFRESRPEFLVSLEDMVALAHAEEDPNYPETIAWAASRLAAHRVGDLFVLPLRRTLDELASSSIRAEHLSSDLHPYALTDLLEQTALRAGCGAVVVDVRAGLVPLAAQFVLDPSVCRVFVTTLAKQSLAATVALVAFVARELRKIGAEPAPPLLIVNRIPGILRDLREDEKLLSPALAEMTESLLADRTQEAASEETVLDDALELDPIFVAKLGEVGDLQVPASKWEGYSSQLIKSGFTSSLLPLTDQWLSVVLEERQNSEVQAPVPAMPTAGNDVLLRKLAEFASKLVAAETADQPVSDPLVTRPIRALAMETIELPVVVVEGAKGTGKTLTARYMISRRTLGSLAEGAGVTAPVNDAYFLPVLGSVQVSDKFQREIDVVRGEISDLLGTVGLEPAHKTREYLKEKLKEALSEREWVSIWLDTIGWAAGIEPGVPGSGQKLLTQLRAERRSLVCIVEGIEELYESANTPGVSAMLRAILIDLPVRLRGEPGRPLGLIVFARRDSVDAGVSQNRSQFRTQYQEFALTWTEGDVLELAAWIATKSGALALWDSNFAELGQSEKEKRLFRLWGRKLGPDDQPGQNRVKEAYTAGWVIAALSDLQGRLVARDLVRFLQTAAETEISDERDPYQGRLLAPSSLKAAIGPTSRQKVAETEEEIEELKEVFAKFREKRNSVKAPIEQDALQALGLSNDDIALLRFHGIILGDAPPYEVPELFRMGLGLRHAGARHSVIGTRRRARLRLKADS